MPHTHQLLSPSTMVPYLLGPAANLNQFFNRQIQSNLTVKKGVKKSLQRLQTEWRLIYQRPQRQNRHLGVTRRGWLGKELCHGESCKPQ